MSACASHCRSELFEIVKTDDFERDLTDIIKKYDTNEVLMELEEICRIAEQQIELDVQLGKVAGNWHYKSTRFPFLPVIEIVYTFNSRIIRFESMRAIEYYIYEEL